MTGFYVNSYQAQILHIIMTMPIVFAVIVYTLAPEFGLIDTKPSEHLVFSHGDMSDGNLLISNGEIGFIDWGRGGIADIWCDIAHAAQNVEELLGANYLKLFFEELEMDPDWSKIRYHLWLDELF